MTGNPRVADENFAPPCVSFRELTMKAQRLAALTGRPQIVHTHEHGRGCTYLCDVISPNGHAKERVA